VSRSEIDMQEIQNIPEQQPQEWLSKHKTTRHFLVEFFVVLFSNLTQFFKKKDQEIEREEHITDSVIKKD